MNIAATKKDILHAVGLVKPSCIAIVQNRLSVLQAAIQSLPEKPKIFTVLGKDGQLPHVRTTMHPRMQNLPPDHVLFFSFPRTLQVNPTISLFPRWTWAARVAKIRRAPSASRPAPLAI